MAKAESPPYLDKRTNILNWFIDEQEKRRNK